MHRTLRVNTSKIFQEPQEVFTEAYLEPCQTLDIFAKMLHHTFLTGF